MVQYLELSQDAFVWAGRVADTARIIVRQLMELDWLTEDWHVENILVQVVTLDVNN